MYPFERRNKENANQKYQCAITKDIVNGMFIGPVPFFFSFLLLDPPLPNLFFSYLLLQVQCHRKNSHSVVSLSLLSSFCDHQSYHVLRDASFKPPTNHVARAEVSFFTLLSFFLLHCLTYTRYISSSATSSYRQCYSRGRTPLTILFICTLGSRYISSSPFVLCLSDAKNPIMKLDS